MTPAHWLSGGSGNDAGFEDLQTDVMRFMAILAFCLMAVFALVQSLPLTPEPPPAPAAATPAPAVSPRATPAAPEPPPQAASAVAEAPVKASATPVPAAPPTAAPSAGEVSRPLPAPEAIPTEPLPAPAAPAAAVASTEPSPAPAVCVTEPIAPPAADAEAVDPSEEGVTLRFSSDAALRRLVARGKVGLFAFSNGQSWRLAPSLSEDTFRAANAPTEFHAMAAGTVPDAVVAAMTQQTGADGRTVSWGVTLPLPTRYAIARLVREFSSGALVIGSDGRVTREAP